MGGERAMPQAAKAAREARVTDEVCWWGGRRPLQPERAKALATGKGNRMDLHVF